MNPITLILTFLKQLFQNKWDGAGSFLAMLQMPDKKKHFLFANALGLALIGATWLAHYQPFIHPYSACVLLFGTIIVVVDEFDQFLHNQDLVAAGQPPDRGITIWDMAAGWSAILIWTVICEAVFNREMWLAGFYNYSAWLSSGH